MKGIDLRAAAKTLAKNKYVLLVLCAGLGLLLLPGRGGGGAAPGASEPAPAEGMPMEASGIPLDTECGRIAALLGAIRGVGETTVLLSAQGCVVVCRGADNASVRLAVTSAVSAYTGLGSDRICVIPMQ